MASRTVVYLEDDLAGGQADESVEFGLDGINYVIDLNQDNAARLRESLADFIAAGRRAGVAKATSGPRRSSGVDVKAVRAWAESNGHQVSHRGRISKKVLEAFKAAGN